MTLWHKRLLCPGVGASLLWSWLRFMSVELVMLSNHLILAAQFSFYFQSFPASGSFPMSRLFASGGQSVGASVSASVLPMNIYGLFPLQWAGWISLHPKGFSRVFSSPTIQKHDFFSSQPSLWFNSHIHTWLLEKPTTLTTWTLVSKEMPLLDMLSRVLRAFLPRWTCLFILSLRSPSALI